MMRVSSGWRFSRRRAITTLHRAEQIADARTVQGRDVKDSAKSMNGKRRSISWRIQSRSSDPTVPLVDRHHKRAESAHSRSVESCSLNPSCASKIRINHMRRFHSLKRFDDTEFLNGLADARAFAHPAVSIKVCVDRRARRARRCCRGRARLVEGDTAVFARMRLSKVYLPRWDGRSRDANSVVLFREGVFDIGSAGMLARTRMQDPVHLTVRCCEWQRARPIRGGGNPRSRPTLSRPSTLFTTSMTFLPARRNWPAMASSVDTRLPRVDHEQHTSALPPPARTVWP